MRLFIILLICFIFSCEQSTDIGKYKKYGVPIDEFERYGIINKHYVVFQDDSEKITAVKVPEEIYRFYHNYVLLNYLRSSLQKCEK